ncbi:hypothetical protein MD484_g4212, partial [Candolleomyces efflorescens]
MSSYVGGIAPKSPGALPSDAELEAEAERERERSRREAEAILTREAQQRKQVEERMAAMFDSTKNLPPPPSSKPYPTTPSPASSHKEGTGWWQATKNRLTPTKDKESPITPAQQIILDAKAKDRSIKGKDREDTSPNPFTSTTNLNIPVQPPTRKPAPASPSSPTPSRPSLSTPNLSPSPMRTAGSFTDSPSREAPPVYAQFNPQGALDVPGTLLAIAKRFEKLEKWTIGHVRALEDRMNDVERWLVEKESGKEDEKAVSGSGTRPADPSPALQQEISEIRDEVSELQGRVGELGREMAKMATAPANLSSGPRTQTASVNVVQRQPSATLVHENSFEAPISDAFTTPRHSRLASASARESTSPPLASNRTSSGTRLPYPTGDYNSPPDSTFSPTNSPPASINSKLRNKSMSVSGISGLPSSSYSGGGSGSPISSVFNIASTLNARPLSPPATSTPKASATGGGATSGGRTASPVPAATTKTTSGLPPPKAPSQRQGSVSPTPRKRYTVALGGPIVAPPDLDDNNDSLQSNGAADLASSIRRVATPRSALKSLPPPGDDDEDGEEEEDGGETIGKSASLKYTRNLTKKRSNASLSSVTSMSSVDKEVLYRRPAVHDSSTSTFTSTTAPATAPAPPTGNSGGRRHARAQSVYNLSSITGGAHFNASTTNVTSTANLNTTAPLRLSKGRSKSSDRLKSSSSNSSFSSINSSGLGGDAFSGTPLDRPPVTPNSTKFVDPLLLRRKQEVAASTPVGVAKGSGGKLAVGQLVAFFDKERKERKGKR